MHHLDGAYARLDRANVHIADLRFWESRLIDKSKDGLRLQQDDDSGAVNVRWAGVADPIAENADVSILIGEAVYNLRAALDYLVYEIAKHDSGVEQRGTQFPVCDTKPDFDRRRGAWLKGVNPTHISAIEVLQPYKGCNWTKLLARISNPDKHRKLTLCQGMIDGALTVRVGTPEELPALREGAIDPTPLPEGGTIQLEEGEQVEMEAHFTLFIAFDDGNRVIPTLKLLKSEIARVLKAFQSEF